MVSSPPTPTSITAAALLPPPVATERLGTLPPPVAAHRVPWMPPPAALLVSTELPTAPGEAAPLLPDVPPPPPPPPPAITPSMKAAARDALVASTVVAAVDASDVDGSSSTPPAGAPAHGVPTAEYRAEAAARRRSDTHHRVVEPGDDSPPPPLRPRTAVMLAVTVLGLIGLGAVVWVAQNDVDQALATPASAVRDEPVPVTTTPPTTITLTTPPPDPAAAPDTTAPAEPTTVVPTTAETATTVPAPPAPAAGVPVGVSISSVLGGDTLLLTDGSVVRLIGLSAPAAGACGDTEATLFLTSLVLTGGEPVLSQGIATDVDGSGRLLRYLDLGGRDAGLAVIQQGLARAWAEGSHPREAAYVDADLASQDLCPGG
jgi:endonuclease YncB( thermonuclease family)